MPSEQVTMAIEHVTMAIEQVTMTLEMSKTSRRVTGRWSAYHTEQVHNLSPWQHTWDVKFKVKVIPHKQQINQNNQNGYVIIFLNIQLHYFKIV